MNVQAQNDPKTGPPGVPAAPDPEQVPVAAAGYRSEALQYHRRGVSPPADPEAPVAHAPLVLLSGVAAFACVLAASAVVRVPEHVTATAFSVRSQDGSAGVLVVPTDPKVRVTVGAPLQVTLPGAERPTRMTVGMVNPDDVEISRMIGDKLPQPTAALLLEAPTTATAKLPGGMLVSGSPPLGLPMAARIEVGSRTLLSLAPRVVRRAEGS